MGKTRLDTVRYAFLLALALLVAHGAYADDKTFTSSCGDASVRLILRSADSQEVGYDEVILTAKTKSRDIKLVFDDGWFHAACMSDKRGNRYIVFQNYCTGSGCFDLDNYGIIDAKRLKVLLVPSDTNRKDASRLLGQDVPPLYRYKGSFCCEK